MYSIDARGAGIVRALNETLDMNYKLKVLDWPASARRMEAMI